MRSTDGGALTPERAANLAENPYAGQGSVLLDIGDDVGAVVLHLPAELEGAEVEYHREGQAPLAHHHDGHAHTHAPHVAVVGRPAPAGVAYTAVIPELASGRYVLTLPDRTELRVEVAGGEVTETRWPG
jgi:hypothetical protein